MSETDLALNTAKAKLQAPTREKSPRYHVFKLTSVEESVEDKFLHLTAGSPVKAPSRKAAIGQVSAAFNKAEAEAETYLLIAEKEFKLLTRKVQTKLEEVFE